MNVVVLIWLIVVINSSCINMINVVVLIWLIVVVLIWLIWLMNVKCEINSRQWKMIADKFKIQLL
jgi:hypothetical protein